MRTRARGARCWDNRHLFLFVESVQLVVDLCRVSDDELVCARYVLTSRVLDCAETSKLSLTATFLQVIILPLRESMNTVSSVLFQLGYATSDSVFSGEALQ